MARLSAKFQRNIRKYSLWTTREIWNNGTKILREFSINFEHIPYWGKLRKLYTYFWITNEFIKEYSQFFIFYLYLSFVKAVFREVIHGLFTFNAAPFNSMYFLSLLAVHELRGWRFLLLIFFLRHLFLDIE